MTRTWTHAIVVGMAIGSAALISACGAATTTTPTSRTATSGLSATPGAAPTASAAPVVLSASDLSRFDTASGTDGVTWAPTTSTIEIHKPGTYRIDGTISADIEIDSSPGVVDIMGGNKNYSDADFSTQTQRDQFFNKRTGAAGASVTVGPSGTVDAPGYTTSALLAVFDPTPGATTKSPSVVEAAPDNHATVDLHNFTIFGDAENAVQLLDGDVDGHVANLIIVSPAFDVSGNRPGGSGGGGVAIGQGGTLEDSFIKVSDDAIKPMGAGATATDVRVDLQDSGSAVQFGWGPGQSKGHVEVSDITVNGWLRPRSAEGHGAGDAVVSGVIGGTGKSDYVAQGIDVDPDQGKTFPVLVRLQFPDAAAVPGVSIGMQLSSTTPVFGPVDGSAPSFVFVRPTDLARQSVTLAAHQLLAGGGSRTITPAQSTFAKDFLIPSTVGVVSPTSTRSG